MSAAVTRLFHREGWPSFTEQLFRGRFGWDLLRPFPVESPQRQRDADRIVAELRALLRQRVDPLAVDVTGRLPEGLVEELRAGGYLTLTVDPKLGGRGLSPYQAFQVIESAAAWSIPAALVMAIDNAIGLAGYLPLLPDGPLRDLVADRITAGTVSGTADTEAHGAANRSRLTVAVPVEGGQAYQLTGDKVHIGNAPVADVLWTLATVQNPDAEPELRLFVVDTDSPGLSVSSWHEFMGLRGFPNGAVSLREVRVPAERMLVEGHHDERLTPGLTRALAVGRMYLIAAPSLAIARGCLAAAHEFVSRRSVDGRGLGEYDEVQRILADCLADMFAIESVVQWSMLGAAPESSINVTYEQVAAKNIASVAAWRVVERTMSLLASEGFETAGSKRRRGAPAMAVERLFRDARGLRISGGVDFLLDYWFSKNLAMASYFSDPAGGAESGVPAGYGAPTSSAGPAHRHEAGLSARNSDHLEYLASEVGEFARTCQRLATEHTDADLDGDEHTHVALGGWSLELIAMSLVLARAASTDGSGEQRAQGLADVFCTAARERVAAAHRQVRSSSGPDFADLAAGFLRGEPPDPAGVATPLTGQEGAGW